MPEPFSIFFGFLSWVGKAFMWVINRCRPDVRVKIDSNLPVQMKWKWARLYKDYIVGAYVNIWIQNNKESGLTIKSLEIKKSELLKDIQQPSVRFYPNYTLKLEGVKQPPAKNIIEFDMKANGLTYETLPVGKESLEIQMNEVYGKKYKFKVSCVFEKEDKA